MPVWMKLCQSKQADLLFSASLELDISVLQYLAKFVFIQIKIIKVMFRICATCTHNVAYHLILLNNACATVRKEWIVQCACLFLNGTIGHGTLTCHSLVHELQRCKWTLPLIQIRSQRVTTVPMHCSSYGQTHPSVYMPLTSYGQKFWDYALQASLKDIIIR